MACKDMKRVGKKNGSWLDWDSRHTGMLKINVDKL